MAVIAIIHANPAIARKVAHVFREIQAMIVTIAEAADMFVVQAMYPMGLLLSAFHPHAKPRLVVQGIARKMAHVSQEIQAMIRTIVVAADMFVVQAMSPMVHHSNVLQAHAKPRLVKPDIARSVVPAWLRP